MATTTNFGWETPDDTDLVKDGAAAIRTALGGVDTSFVDLKGGTTGQVLAKASNTDLDFVWSADASGIPATIFDAKGDLIAASAADTAARVAVGTNGQVLTADSTAAAGVAWTTPSAGAGAMAQIATGTLSGTSVTLNSLSTYSELVLRIYAAKWGTLEDSIRVLINNNTGGNYEVSTSKQTGSSSSYFNYGADSALIYPRGSTWSNTSGANVLSLKFTNCKTTGFTDFDTRATGDAGGSVYNTTWTSGVYKVSEAVSSLVIKTSDGYTFSAGTYTLWGA